MDQFTTSFITKQKLVNNSLAVTGRNYANNFVASNTAATYIFDQYLFREDLIYTSSVPSCTYEEPTFFSNILRLSALSHVNCNTFFPDKHKLDIFAFYITVQLAFKVNHSVILARPNDLAFFCYYNKAFSGVGSVINYSFDLNKQLISATKQSRLDYQRKFDSRRQGTFVTNGSQRAVSLFNRVFFKNNSSFTSKKKVQTFFSKKLRSTKAIREAALENDYRKRFQSQKQKQSFIMLYKKTQKRRVSAVSLFKPVALFPQSIWFRGQVQKVLSLQKRGKKGKKSAVIPSSSLTYVKKNGSYYKGILPTALHFKLFPTDYEEATLNSNRFGQFKALVSLITNSRFSFYQINALSLTRFMFDTKIKATVDINGFNTKLSYFYLNSRERQRVSRYRYIGVYLKDLIRVCFFSRYLKKADFLATFFAFTISKLPRNRKELKFVHFLIKLLKRSAWQNKDILGIRVRFQGRLNRWRRTKHIVGSKGNIAFSTYHNRIEYGMAQAITRKGTLGVHIWIAYLPGSFSALSKSIIAYSGLTSLAVSLK